MEVLANLCLLWISGQKLISLGWCIRYMQMMKSRSLRLYGEPGLVEFSGCLSIQILVNHEYHHCEALIVCL